MRLLGPAVLLGVLAATAAARPPVYELITGSDHDYVVAPGDTVWAITGRFTMSRPLFDALNALPDPDHLHPGTRLRVSDRHIVPRRGNDGIVVDLADRLLFWFQKGTLVARFPVATGRTGWTTPPGRYRIVGRRADPVWRVPASIQAEMRARGEPVVARMPAGPDNPLGRYWIQLSVPGYGLHGTNAPGSVGKYATHGCLRLRPEDIERLYREAGDGTPVEVMYEPVKIARLRTGNVLLEVHRDVYASGDADVDRVVSRLKAAGLVDTVDLLRVAEAVGRAWGVPEDVSRAPRAPRVVPAAQH